MNTNYQSWLVENNSYAKSHIFATEGPDCKWGRVKAEWMEWDDPVRKITYRTHTFSLSINRETGEFYDDCTKKKVYAKMIAFTLTRPFIVFANTLYYACFPVAMTLAYRNARKEINKSKDQLEESEISARCRQAAFEALADVVRTPLYGIAMTVVSATALIIGPFAPKKLYDFREMENQLLRKYYRIPDGYVPDLFQCFISHNLQSEELYKGIKRDTNYLNPYSDVDRGMTNYARAWILHYRENTSVCFNNGRKLEKDEIYTSTTVADIEKLQSTTV